MMNRFDREVTGGIWLEMTFLCNVLIIIFHFLSLKNKLFQNIKLFLTVSVMIPCVTTSAVVDILMRYVSNG